MLPCDQPPQVCHLSGTLLFSTQTWASHREVLCAGCLLLVSFLPLLPSVVALTKDGHAHAPGRALLSPGSSDAHVAEPG